MTKVSQAKLEKLLAQIALNDRQAFKQLYQLHASTIHGIAFRIVGNQELANEVTQDAFIQIWRNSAEYNPAKAQANTWMSAITRYRAYDILRREGRRIEGSQIVLYDADIDSVPNARPDLAALVADNDALNRCLKTLDSEQRDAILMAYYYGFSREELAGYFKRTINTIKSMLRRGIMRLQVCLLD